MNKLRFIALAILGLLGCRESTYLRVEVQNLDGLDARPRSLEVLVSREGESAASLPFIELPERSAEDPLFVSDHFLLKLPDGLSTTEPLQVAVAAFSEADGRGCLLGVADKEIIRAEVSGTTYVALEKPARSYCGTSRPILLDATPKLSRLEGNQKVRLSGWGFRPKLTAVHFGTEPAMILSTSATHIDLLTPPKAGFGPVSIKVTNLDSLSDERRDLMCYYTETPFLLDYDRQDDSAEFVASDLIMAQLFENPSPVWTNPHLGQVHILKYQAKVTPFRTPYRFPNPPLTSAVGMKTIAAGDFDKDGDIDFAVAYESPTAGDIEIFSNDGTGTSFTATSNFAIGMVRGESVQTIRSLRATDLNGDGYADLLLLVHLPMNSNDQIVIYMNNQAGGFLQSNPPVHSAGGANSSITTAVTGRLGYVLPDIVSVTDDFLDPGGENIRILLNRGDGTFTRSGNMYEVKLPQKCQRPTAMQVADLNSDGQQDLVVACGSTSSLLLFMVAPGQVLPVEFTLPLDAEPTAVAVADVNGDCRLDLIAPTDPAGPGKIHIFLQDPESRTFTSSRHVEMKSECPGEKRVLAADFDGDRYKTADLFLIATTPGRTDNGCRRGYVNFSVRDPL